MNTTDLSKLKIPFAAKNEIFTKLCGASIGNSVAEEYSLPDYIPDIKRVLNTSARVSTGTHGLDGGRIVFEGDIAFTVFLLTEENTLKSVTIPCSYKNATEEIGEYSDKTEISVISMLESASGKLMNPRKIMLSAEVSTSVNATSQSGINPAIEGVKCAADELSLERDTVRTNTLTFSSDILDSQVLSEDIVIDGQLPPAAEILCCDVEVFISENKQVSSVLQMTGEASVTILYTDESGKPYRIMKRVAVSSNISAGDGTDFFAVAQVSDIKTQIAADSYGENRVIELDVTYSVLSFRMANREVSYVSDIYSVSSDCRSQFAQRDIYTLRKCVNANFSVNASRQSEEVNAGGSDNVIAAFVSLKKENLQYDDERKKTVFSGNAQITMLISAEEGYKSISFTEPFKYETDIQPENGEFEYMHTMTAANIRGRIDSASVYADFEIMLGIVVLEKAPASVVACAALGEPLAQEKSRPPLTLYYPARGERLWDIAKHYNTTRDAIMSANNMESDTVLAEKVLLIPKSKRGSKPGKNAVFEKII